MSFCPTVYIPDLCLIKLPFATCSLADEPASLCVCRLFKPLGHASVLVGSSQESARLFRGSGVHKKVRSLQMASLGGL